MDFVRTAPRLFGVVYKLGEAYTKLQEHLPHHSPVYLFQRKTARTLKQYLEKSQPDVIVTTHVFAGEMLTMLRNEGMKLPPVVYIATDYTSIPFTQEVQADRYIVGHKDIVQSFVAAGLPEWKILPYGIPVNEAFQSRMSRPDACRWLGLDPAKRHILLSGGSMGSGPCCLSWRNTRTLCFWCSPAATKNCRNPFTKNTQVRRSGASGQRTRCRAISRLVRC